MRAIYFGIISALIVLFALYSGVCMEAAVTGFDLFITKVFPALFPFAVLINSLNAFRGSGGAQRLGLFSLLRLFIICALSGSPSGTIIVSKELAVLPVSKRSRLSAVLNLSSPVFIIGTVGASFFRITRIKPLLPLIIGHYSSALIIGMLLIPSSGINKADELPDCMFDAKKGVSPAAALTSGIYLSMQTMLRILGTIVFFNVISSLIVRLGLLDALNPIVRSSVLGLIEMTGGINMLSTCAGSFELKLILCSFLISFGGFSIMMQAASSGVTSVIDYSIVKLLHGFLSAALTAALIPLFINDAEAVFSDASVRLAFSRMVTVGGIGVLMVVSVSLSCLLAVFSTKHTAA